MELEERVAALEAAVARLTGTGSAAVTDSRPAVESTDPNPDRDSDFWYLEELERREPEGAVAFTGSVEVPERGPVRWQYGSTSERLAEADWSAYATQLDALGHPVRLTLLQLIHSGVRSTAELAAQEGLGTTGQLHHHLRVLINAGWLASTGRGHYEIPATRVIPLLAIILAARPT